jgi:hypothetical protein
MSDTRSVHVAEDLENARRSGYGRDLAAMTDEEIAADLITYCAECEHASTQELLPHIREWRARAFQN